MILNPIKILLIVKIYFFLISTHVRKGILGNPDDGGLRKCVETVCELSLLVMANELNVRGVVNFK